jgi:K+-sensing histidine kinase KdpD
VDLLLVDRSGTVIADLGELMDRNPQSGVSSAVNASALAGDEAKPASTISDGIRIYNWLLPTVERCKMSDGWVSTRSPAGSITEAWCLALAHENSELVLIMSDWVPVAQLVRGPTSLATIIHDLKNPIGAMFGYADALLDTELGAGLAANHQQIIERIRKASVRSLDLLKNYESLLFVDQKKKAAATDFNKLVKLVVDTSGIRNEKTATIITEYAPGALPVKVAKFAIDRIVSNLIGNAVKYTPAGGRVHIRTFRWGEAGHGESYEGIGHAALEVTNSAPIIPEKERLTIFSARTRGSTGKDRAGTGMGLYTAKVLTESASGSLTLSADANKGNTFRVLFPLADAEEKEQNEVGEFFPE